MSRRNVGADPHPGILDDVTHLLPVRGRALDVACGTGAASIFLARHGLEVVAWDISPIAIGKLRIFAARHELAIEPEVVDIAQARIPQEAFDVIFVSRYLERSACAGLSRALRPGGLLVYQTFSIEALESAPHMNPAYCLVRGELLNLFHDLQPVLYREDALVGDTTRGLRNEARLVAQRRYAAPGFFVDWVRRVTDGDDPAALSRAIERHRRRLAALDDPLGPWMESAPAARDNGRCLFEDTDVVVVADGQAPTLRALVHPKGNLVLPTDMPHASVCRLGRVVDVITQAFRQVADARHCRSWIPHPDDCSTRRLHVVVDSDLRRRRRREAGPLARRRCARTRGVARMTTTGAVLWLTGLSGSGKSTLSRHAAQRLRGLGCRVEVLDGDDMRNHLCAGLGFSRQDRDTNVRRIGHVARLLSRHGVVAIAAAISPYRQARDEQRQLVEADGALFCEVYLECPLDVLVARDVKGLYRKALAGEVAHFTGISDPYEPPAAPDVIVRSDQQDVDAGVASVLLALRRKGLWRQPEAGAPAQAHAMGRCA